MSKDDEGEKVAKLSTGVIGIDELTQGGYPEGGVHIVSGPPGSGKSLLGMHFLMEGSKKGEVGLYISLEEEERSLLKAMRGLGIGVEDEMIKEKLMIIDLTEMRESTDVGSWMALSPSEADLPQVMSFKPIELLLKNIFEMNEPKRVVIDSIVAIGLSYDNLSVFRKDLFIFCKFLRRMGVTSVLLTESDDETGLMTRYKTEAFVGDSFLTIGNENVQGELRRSLTIRKMRFTDHDTAQHPLFIGKGGITVKPEAKVF